MRHIKFRVWDKQKREFFPIKNGMALSIGDTDKYLSFVTNQGLYPIPPTGQKDLGEDRWVLQQFTGLYDSEDEEIYEGDIVKYHTNGELVRPADHISEVFWIKGDLWPRIENDCIVGNNCTVIGNIFENPELLKEVN